MSGTPRAFRDCRRRGRQSVPFLGAAFVVLAPAVGGLVYGPLVSRFAPAARGHGVPEMMLAVPSSGEGSGRRCRR